MAAQFGFPPTTSGLDTYQMAIPAKAAEGPAAYQLPPSFDSVVQQTAVKPEVGWLKDKPAAHDAARDAASGALSGLSAASQIAPGNDPASAATSAGASALAAGGTAFVASGFNPVVGLVAGGAGALSSLVNSWMTTKAERKRSRDQKRILDEAERKQAERDRIARRDAIEQQGYDRKQMAVRTEWEKNKELMARMTASIAQNAALKDRFVKLGRV